MIPMLAVLVSAAVGGLGAVKAVSVVPAGERTEVVIEVDGDVQVNDFRLSDPHRLVIDLSGAEHALPRDRFAVARGGVIAVRTSQFRAEVVRVVVELDRAVPYTIDHRPGSVRVLFRNPADQFEAWHSRPGAASPAAAAPTPEPAASVDRNGSHEVGPDLDRGVATTRAADLDLDIPVPAPAPTVLRPQPRRAPALPASEFRRSEEPRIFVFFKDTSVRDVLTTFADFSGRSIIAGAGVSATVTADIRNQPWDIAMRAILESHDLEAREEESGIIRVEKRETVLNREKQEREREEYAEIETRQFRIRYARVDTIIPAVRGLLSDKGNVTGATTTNTLLVTDRRSVLDRIAPMIQELDVRAPQVTIAARIVFIDRTALQQYGIAYDLKDRHGNRINSLFSTEGDPTDADVVVNLTGESIGALANANIPLPRSTLQVVTSLVLGRHTLIGFLEALQELSLSEIRAEPVIRTLSHREAYVLVGERTPIRVIDLGTATGNQPPRATVDIQETGIILRATPHVTGNQILLELHAENSKLALAPSDIGYTFQTQESKTQVLLDDGETAVISGLTIVERNRVRTGVPLLMDIPVLGALFRGHLEQESKKDLLIMVTPHIAQEG